MQKKIVCGMAVLICAAAPAFAFEPRDADAAFNSYNSNFYTGAGGIGFYKRATDGGLSGFWREAEQIELIEDAAERSGGGARQMIAESIAGFTNQFGANWSWNRFNDDDMWMTIACARGYSATGNGAFRDLAKRNFDAVYARAWDMKLGGGLWWTTHRRGKHACVAGPAAIAACLLCEICDDKSYLIKAKAIYAWERSTLFNPASGAVHDNIKVNGSVGRKVYTYNEGTFIGAANLLWELTGDTNYLNDAMLAANFTRHKLSHGGNLPAYHSGDAAGFNGIFMRWMARFVKDNNLWPKYYSWMSANADAAWRVRRADNLSWQNWNKPTPQGILESWNCSDTVVILQVVPPKQPVKNDSH